MFYFYNAMDMLNLLSDVKCNTVTLISSQQVVQKIYVGKGWHGAKKISNRNNYAKDAML